MPISEMLPQGSAAYADAVKMDRILQQAREAQMNVDADAIEAAAMQAINAAKNSPIGSKERKNAASIFTKLNSRANSLVGDIQKNRERLKEEQSNAARIQGASALFESKVNEAQKSGRQTDPNLITAARNLIGAGQIDQATKIEEALFGQPVSTSEQVSRMELESKIEEKDLKKAEAENTYYSIQTEREKIKNLLASDLSDVVGPTEPVARFGRAVASEMGAEWAQKNQSLIKDALMVTTSDVLKSVRALAPVTEQDRKFISKMTVPVETDNAQIWKDYLKEKYQVLGRAEKNLNKKYNISGTVEEDQQETQQNKPQTATQKLRGRLQ
jgi:hypothetical protein